MARALVIIAQKGYQDVELEGTRNGLLEGNFTVILCSTTIGSCEGKLGGSEEATESMRDVDVSQFDRFAFIGGPGAGVLKDDIDAVDLARRIATTGKPFGAICIAPTILAAAGVLDGKQATVWNKDGEQGTFLESHGAIFTDADVTVDGLLVTGNGLEAAEEFGRRLANL
jgi:protease I